MPISALYKLGQALLTEQQANLNRDLLEKEVTIFKYYVFFDPSLEEAEVPIQSELQS